MVTFRLLPIFHILAILCTTPSLGYTVFGTKRYNGHNPGVRRATNNNNYSWGSPIQPYPQYVRSQRFPVNYYEMYPYSPEYQDDYYHSQEPLTYPVYITPPRTSKYEVYQAVLPYYYGERPLPRQDYGYYGYDKNSNRVEDLEDEMLQEAEREEREDAQPIGQEVLYENEPDDGMDEANAAFLQNLIMSQMYKNKQRDYYDPYPNTDYYFDEDDYGKWEDSVGSRKQYQEDEDVRELKQLAKPEIEEKYVPTAAERLHVFRNEKNSNKNSKSISNKNNRYNWETKRAVKDRDSDRKGVLVSNGLAVRDRKINLKGKLIPSTAIPIYSTNVPKAVKINGQKEEVLMRPATSVKNPFSDAVIDMVKDQPQRKREPSVFDTIKHMLDMEKSLENNYSGNEIRPPMKKRIVSSEDSLTHQLSVLKKTL